MISAPDHPTMPAGGPESPTHTVPVDSVLAEAVEVARAALVEQVGADVVGDSAGFVAESEGVLTQYFACTQSGYPGWRWAVTIARAEDATAVTVDEVVLLPGDESILPPSWVPYRERIQPGDLSPGDILPTDEDDPRLVPAYLTGDELTDPTSWRPVADELGLGRARVLSLEGRDLAAERWYDGEQGPDSPLAQAAPHHCHSCGFLLRISGPLATVFGVCANSQANDDGRVVAFGHGCGAHSEAQLRKKQLPVPVPDPSFDTISVEELERF